MAKTTIPQALITCRGLIGGLGSAAIPFIPTGGGGRGGT